MITEQEAGRIRELIERERATIDRLRPKPDPFEDPYPFERNTALATSISTLLVFLAASIFGCAMAIWHSIGR